MRWFSCREGKPMVERIFWRIASALMHWCVRRCTHRGEHVLADLLEGDGRNLAVAYCRRCGAVSLRTNVLEGAFRLPEPTQYPQHGGER